MGIVIKHMTIEKGMICKEVNKALNTTGKFKTSYVHQGVFFFFFFHFFTASPKW